MDLELPSEAECLLCGDETVVLKENKRGNPFFTCGTFNCAVNLRPESETGDMILNEAVDEPADQQAGSDDSEESGGETIGDLLGESDDG